MSFLGGLPLVIYRYLESVRLAILIRVLAYHLTVIVDAEYSGNDQSRNVDSCILAIPPRQTDRGTILLNYSFSGTVLKP